MKEIILAMLVLISIAGCSAKSASEVNVEKETSHEMKNEELRVSDELVLPHHIPNSGALSKEIVKIEKPEGLRVKYLAPKLISSSIYVQTLNEPLSEEKTIKSQATHFAEVNVINLRKQGVDDVTLLEESFVSKFSETDVAYQRVVRNDLNKVLHIYFFSIDEKVIFIQSWSNYRKENEGYRMRFDTFVYDLIKNLESQILINE
ncbi:hypothetical protein [Idiomarina sp.]|uniref:hypothetical protein n=1 Tax=Idiomarina sp. TaxID=1874361 RepID=UPI003A8DD429